MQTHRAFLDSARDAWGMGPFKMRTALFLYILCTSIAHAHPKGFHKKLTFTVTRYDVTGLLVMDVDSGERCSLLRAGADENHDGQLDAAETAALRNRLQKMATRALTLKISGFPLPLTVKDAKLSLRDDRGTGETGLSLALLLEIVHPFAVTEGTSLEVQDTAPDLSTIRLEVLQLTSPDAGSEPPFSEDVESGKKQRIRLGVLDAAPTR